MIDGAGGVVDRCQPAIVGSSMRIDARRGDVMRRTLILLPGLALLAACQQHSAGYDDAWARCEAEAIQQQETAEPDPDQRATWREQYIRDCMSRAGFTE
jgi:hypothetical protein